MKKRTLILTAIVTIWLGSPVATVSADTVAIAPFTWGTLGDGADGAADGTPDFVEARRRIIAGYSNTNPQEFRGVMEFDLNALGQRRAFLNLLVFQILPPAEVLPVQLYGYIGDGRFSASDFYAGELLDTFTVSSLGTVSLDVSSFAASATAHGDRFLGFLLKGGGDPFTNKTNYWFASPNRSNGSSGFPSYLSSSLGDEGALLTVPAPEPGSLMLVSTGALGLTCWRARRRLRRRK